MSARCDRCDKPIATDADWEATPEGEGDGLCWGWGTPSCTAVDWRARALAAEAERDALRAIVEGLEGTPMWRQAHPTQTEAMAHAVSGGLWLGMKPGEMPFVVGFHDDESVGGLALFSDRFPYNDPMDMEWDEVWRPDNFGECVWCPIRSDGRPCAWPVLEVSRG